MEEPKRKLEEIMNIYAYLQGKLEGSELETFENKLKVSLELQKEVKWTQLELASLEQWEKETREEKLKQWRVGSTDRNMGFRRRLFVFFIIGAFLAFLLYLWQVSLRSEHISISPVALSDKYLEAQEPNFVNREEGKNNAFVKTDFQIANDAYIQKKYGAVINLLDSVSLDHPLYDRIVFLKALAYIKLDQLVEARDILLEQAQNTEAQINQQAEWLLYLLYIRQLPASKSDLEEIQAKIKNNPDHSFYHIAVKLEKELTESSEPLKKGN